MSTVQELPNDSPTTTVPVRYSVLPESPIDGLHNRSSSAPGEYVRDSQTLPVQEIKRKEVKVQTAWTGKQSGSQPPPGPKGLGLSLSGNINSTAQPTKRVSSRPKPNLRIEIKNEVDKPPPPPPKSPRHHARNPSTQLRASIGDALAALPTPLPTVATAGNVVRAALVDTHSSPSHTPTGSVSKGIQLPLSEDVRLSDLMGASPVEGGSEEDTAPGSTPASASPSLDSTENLSSAKSETSNVDKSIPSSNQHSDKTETTKSQPPDADEPARIDGDSIDKSDPLATRLDADKPTHPQDLLQERPIPAESSESNREKSSGPPNHVAKSFADILSANRSTDNLARPTQQTNNMLLRARSPNAHPANARPPMYSPNPSLDRTSLLKSSRPHVANLGRSTQQNSGRPVPVKSPNLNIDKPMPSLPPASSRFSAHMREVRKAEGEQSRSRRPTEEPPMPKSDQTSEGLRTPGTDQPVKADDSPEADLTPKPEHTPRLDRSPEMDSRAKINKSPKLDGTPKADSRPRVEFAAKADRGPHEERTPEAVAPDVESQKSALAETKSLARIVSIDHPSKKDEVLSIPPPPTFVFAERSRIPTPEQTSRPQSPANLLQTASAGGKSLPVLPPENCPRSATPDSSKALKPSDSPIRPLDPLQTLQELSRQSEALHTRYATLRSDRLKLTTHLSATLREQKAGPEYVNGMLDQHLSLNAINSSMDICFAKLKSLDCRKEEAINIFLEQMKAKMATEEMQSSSYAYMKSPALSSLSIESGRATPEVVVEPATATSPHRSSPMPARPPPEPPKEEKPSPKVETHHQQQEENDSKGGKPSPSSESEEQKDTNKSEKRTTVIHASQLAGKPSVESLAKAMAKSEEMSPVSPLEYDDEEEWKPKRIRVKGAKAAKILGLVSGSAAGRPASPGITLPVGSPTIGSPSVKQVVDIEIQTKQPSSKVGTVKSPLPPKPTAPAPTRQPPPPRRVNTDESSISGVSTRTGPRPSRQNTDESALSTASAVSAVSATSNSQAESSPEEPEVKTPRGSQDGPTPQSAPLGVKNAKTGMLQTVQVFIDDDILDYYNGQTSSDARR